MAQFSRGFAQRRNRVWPHTFGGFVHHTHFRIVGGVSHPTGVCPVVGIAPRGGPFSRRDLSGGGDTPGVEPHMCLL